MKHNISDLVDALSIQDVELENLSPLSSRRIKEITMNKVNKRHTRRASLGRKVLIAAAIIATMAITVLAATGAVANSKGAGNWFRREKNLSDSQVELVNELGSSFKPQTYTDQGTTIEATAAYADEYVLFLYLSVTAPEGTVLPDGIEYDLYDNNATDHSNPNGFRPSFLGGNAPYRASYNFLDVMALPDDNPEDNKKDFVVQLSCLSSTPTRFNDGYTKFLSVKGIYAHVMSDTSQEDWYELIAPCDLQIDITIKNEPKTVALDVAGVHYGGQKCRTWTHDGPCVSGQCEKYHTGETDPENGLPIHKETWDYTTTVNSVTISPTTISYELNFTCSDPNREIGLSYRIVMKDGTVVKSNTFIPSWTREGNTVQAISAFEAPIDLNEVDYIQIGDSELGQSYKYYLPQE